MALIDDVGDGPVCLDTCVFIYLIEENHQYLEIVLPIFEAIDEGRFPAVTSGITLLETLVVPLRARDSMLAQRYEQLLCQSRGLTCLNLDRDLLRLGAELRASYSLKTPDALQIAAAMQSNCTTFITNDRRLPQISGLRIMQLSEYVGESTQG